MKHATRIPLILVALTTAALACNIQVSQPPAQDPNAAFTAAAQTVAAHLTEVVQAQNTPTTIPQQFPTASPIPTLPPAATLPPTIAPPPTNVPPTQECDKAAFIADVTIPDGTILPKDKPFTKTWRLKNVGTCSWTSSYSVVFFSGEAMSGPTVQALTGNINPGQTVDISVNLKSPSSNGNFTGYWKLRNASGATFSQFYVQIKVQGGSGTQVISSQPIAVTSGLVRSDGLVANDLRAGDNNTNQVLETFLSFDISSIPAGSTIIKVIVDFSGATLQSGNPFSISDGCLRGYVDNYGSLDASDYFPGDPLGAIVRWCSWAEIGAAAENPDVAAALQASVGSPRFQMRIQFRAPTTNGNGVADQIRLNNPTLTITYDSP